MILLFFLFSFRISAKRTEENANIPMISKEEYQQRKNLHLINTFRTKNEQKHDANESFPNSYQLNDTIFRSSFQNSLLNKTFSSQIRKIQQLCLNITIIDNITHKPVDIQMINPLNSTEINDFSMINQCFLIPNFAKSEVNFQTNIKTELLSIYNHNISKIGDFSSKHIFQDIDETFLIVYSPSSEHASNVTLSIYKSNDSFKNNFSYQVVQKITRLYSFFVHNMKRITLDISSYYISNYGFHSVDIPDNGLQITFPSRSIAVFHCPNKFTGYYNSNSDSQTQILYQTEITAVNFSRSDSVIISPIPNSGSDLTGRSCKITVLPYPPEQIVCNTIDIILNSLYTYTLTHSSSNGNKTVNSNEQTCLWFISDEDVSYSITASSISQESKIQVISSTDYNTIIDIDPNENHFTTTSRSIFLSYSSHNDQSNEGYVQISINNNGQSDSLDNAFVKGESSILSVERNNIIYYPDTILSTFVVPSYNDPLYRSPIDPGYMVLIGLGIMVLLSGTMALMCYLRHRRPKTESESESSTEIQNRIYGTSNTQPVQTVTYDVAYQNYQPPEDYSPSPDASLSDLSDDAFNSPYQEAAENPYLTPSRANDIYPLAY